MFFFTRSKRVGTVATELFPSFSIDIGINELEQRIGKWLTRDGTPFSKYLKVSLRDYLGSQNLFDDSGRLLRRWRNGEARFPAYLCDYSQLTVACLDLYDSTYDVSWFNKAVQLSKEINSLFRDEDGTYFDTGIDAEVLLTRNAEGSDSVEPSGNSSVIYSFLKLQAYGLPKHYYKDAHRICKSFASHLKKFGISHPAMLSGLHLALSDSKGIVISGKRGEKETELFWP